ncbi:phosphoglycolate phosphatase [Stenotrophomonas sp. MMGLT7]|uniref:phosphoglycolate phosphatase n=1 Tax=Stenotrophomonas sp. MMGLT7 TaxID=2901227 RepID=UPI002F917826
MPNPPSPSFPPAMLFDLDGTLLDSAPDMLVTANAMLADRGRAPLTLAQLRPVVSKGARAMLGVAFPELPTAERDAHVPEFLDRYERIVGQHARLFDGVAAMLAALDAAGSAWGIVSNKPEYLARRVLPQQGWETRCAVLIGGDTLAERKPHPLPLLTAAERIGVAAGACVYVGDDQRDIVAARAAGMPSVAALWGYRLHDDDPLAWQADVLVDAPRQLLDPAAWPAASPSS